MEHVVCEIDTLTCSTLLFQHSSREIKKNKKSVFVIINFQNCNRYSTGKSSFSLLEKTVWVLHFIHRAIKITFQPPYAIQSYCIVKRHCLGEGRSKKEY